MLHVGFGVFLLDSQIQSFIPVFVVAILAPDLDRLKGRESEARRCFRGSRPPLLRLRLRLLRLRGSETRLLATLLVAAVVVVAVLLAEEDGFTCNEVVSLVALQLQLMRLEAPVLGGMLVVMELRPFRLLLASF